MGIVGFDQRGKIVGIDFSRDCQRIQGIHIGNQDGCDFYQYRDFDEVLPFWKMLRPSDSYSPFQQSEWVQAIVTGEREYAKSTCSKPIRYIFIVGFENNKPVMIFSFTIRGGLMGDRLTWIGGKISDYNGITIEKEYCAGNSGIDFNQILQMIYEANPGIHAAILIRNPAESQSISMHNDANAWTSATEYSAHALTLRKDWKELFNSIRSSKSRQRLRSKSRMLRKEGGITFRRIRGAVNCRKTATQILEWKNNQLSKAGCPSPFGTSTQPTSLRLTIDNAVSNEDEPLHVFGLFVSGRLVAGMLAFISNDTFYYYVSSYSENVGKNTSVGTILLIKTIELASRCGLVRYDFLIGDEPYKLDWCDTQISLVHHTKAFDYWGSGICVMFQLSLAVKKTMLRYPKIVASARKISKHLQSFNMKSRPLQYDRSEVSSPADIRTRREMECDNV